MKPALQRFRELSAVDNSLPEQVIRRVAEKVVESADTVIDAGAFMGLHTKHFLSLCRSGNVISYEAQPSYAARLRDQFARYDHVTVRHRALVASDDQGDALLYIDQEFPSRSTIHPETANSEPMTVHAATLDADLEQLEIDVCDVSFLKVDVEGAEFDVLRGSTELMAKGRPLIVIEHGSDAPRIGGYEIAELDRLVTSRGYALLAFDGESLPRFDTRYWYFWLVPAELVTAHRPAIADGFASVLARQESSDPSDRLRRAIRRAGASAKKFGAHRLPESVKRRLRHTFPRI